MRFVILFVMSGLLLGAKEQKGQCPDGSRAVGDHPPNGYELICWKHRRWKHGLATYWHDNGQKKEEGEYRKDQAHGKWTVWYSNGQKEREGSFRNDKRVGKWTTWHSNGKRSEQGSFRNDKRVGKWTGWYSNGQKEQEGSFRNDKMVGKWTTWHENGHKGSEGSLSNGKREGKWTFWSPKGEVGGGSYRGGNPNGKSEMFIGNIRIFCEAVETEGVVERTCVYDPESDEWARDTASRSTWKNGKRESRTCWNRVGNEIECE